MYSHHSVCVKGRPCPPSRKIRLRVGLWKWIWTFWTSRLQLSEKGLFLSLASGAFVGPSSNQWMRMSVAWAAGGDSRIRSHTCSPAFKRSDRLRPSSTKPSQHLPSPASIYRNPASLCKIVNKCNLLARLARWYSESGSRPVTVVSVLHFIKSITCLWGTRSTQGPTSEVIGHT